MKKIYLLLFWVFWLFILTSCWVQEIETITSDEWIKDVENVESHVDVTKKWHIAVDWKYVVSLDTEYFDKKRDSWLHTNYEGQNKTKEDYSDFIDKMDVLVRKICDANLPDVCINMFETKNKIWDYKNAERHLQEWNTETNNGCVNWIFPNNSKYKRPESLQNPKLDRQICNYRMDAVDAFYEWENTTLIIPQNFREHTSTGKIDLHWNLLNDIEM